MSLHIFMVFFSLIIIISFEHFQALNRLNESKYLFKKIIKIVVSKKISDHWKEKIIFKYSSLLLFSSLQLLCIFSLFVVLYFAMNYINPTFGRHLLSINGIIEGMIMVITILFIKKKVYA